MIAEKFTAQSKNWTNKIFATSSLPSSDFFRSVGIALNAADKFVY